MAAIQGCGFEPAGDFSLPDGAWQDDFHAPMLARGAELCGKYAGDVEALAIPDQLAEEPAIQPRHCDFRAYEFYVVRRPV